MSRLLLFSFILILAACKKEAKSIPPKLDKYLTRYMFYSQSSFPVETPPTVYLEYNDQGKVIRRNGAFIPINPNTGFSSVFETRLYDDVSYSGNFILISQHDNIPDVNVIPTPKQILKDHQGRTLRVIQENFPFIYPRYDTTLFYYKGDVLASTNKVNGAGSSTKKFYFDANGNLKKIETLLVNRYSNDTLSLEKEIFSDYDSAPNPLKELGIFDELFYRSLSENNFRKYNYQRSDKWGNVFENINRSWNLNYDDKGKAIFYE